MKKTLFAVFIMLSLGCSSQDGGHPNPSGDGDSEPTGGTTGNPGTGGSAEPGACNGCDNGCCDGDTCVPFSAQTTTECGSDGFTCQACEFGNTCSEGSCQTDLDVCSPLTCSDGCCLEGECVTDTYWAACGSGGIMCGECTYGVECGGDGTCTNFIHDDAIFMVSIDSVELDQTNLGESWDVGSASDPFVCVSNGVEEACTEAECTDSLSCTFPSSSGLELLFTGAELKTSGFEIVVWDDDGVAHDQAGSTAMTIIQLETSYSLDPFGAVLSLELSLQ